MKIKLLIIIGFAMLIGGFSISVYTDVLSRPSTPPLMRPIEGLDYVFFMYQQAFLFSGISGIFVTIAGIVLFWRKRKRKPNF